MPYFNKIYLMGHIGKEPESKFTTQGTHVCKFSVAVSEFYKEQKKTHWFNVTLWKAEKLAAMLHKGQAIFIEGKPEMQEYTSKDGQKRTAFNVVADQIRILSKKELSEPQQEAAEQRYDQEQEPAQQTFDGSQEVPF